MIRFLANGPRGDLAWATGRSLAPRFAHVRNRSLNACDVRNGDFAVPTFLGLLDSPHRVAALYTQPERGGAGRHQHAESAIKRAALERGIAVRQPTNINTEESLAELRALEADVFVVAAYGQLLSPAFLAIPRLRTINVHASVLPRWRGASPINHAIWKGDAETGVTIIEVTPALMPVRC